MKRLFATGLVSFALGLAPVVAHPAVAGSPAPAAAVASDTGGTYVPVAPTRLLDTRSTGKVAAGATRTVQVAGNQPAGIPSSGVSAAVLNLTVTGPTRPGYLSAYPGTSFSGTSALNFTAGETRANLVTVPLAQDGTVTILNGASTGAAPANVIVDVEGYYLDGTTSQATSTAGTSQSTAPAEFYPGDPVRLDDTRVDGEPFIAADIIDYAIGLGSDTLTAATTAVVVNVTAVNPTGPGYLQAWNGLGLAPNASILNLARFQTIPNNAVVPVAHGNDAGGPYFQFSIRNGSYSGSTDLLVDLIGIYSSEKGGLVFRPLDSPVRMVDTRSGKGATKFGPDQTQTIVPTADVHNPDDASQTRALVGNLTAVGSTASTYLTVWPEDERPTVSNLNPAKGQTVANHAYITLSEAADRAFNVYNRGGSTNVLIDIAGYFDPAPSDSASRSARRSGQTGTVDAVRVTHRHAR